MGGHGSADGVSPRPGGMLLPGASPRLGLGGAHGGLAAVVPRIPTIEDTLDSALLRDFFVSTYARMRFTDEQEALWNATSAFHARYAHVPDADVLATQPAARADARAIVDQYADLLRDAPRLRAALDDPAAFVSHNFFRAEEIAIFKRQHSAFETLLTKKGWQ